MKTFQMDWKTHHLELHNFIYLQKFTKKTTQVALCKFNKMSHR